MITGPERDTLFRFCVIVRNSHIAPADRVARALALAQQRPQLASWGHDELIETIESMLPKIKPSTHIDDAIATARTMPQHPVANDFPHKADEISIVANLCTVLAEENGGDFIVTCESAATAIEPDHHPPNKKAGSKILNTLEAIGFIDCIHRGTGPGDGSVWRLKGSGSEETVKETVEETAEESVEDTHYPISSIQTQDPVCKTQTQRVHTDYAVYATALPEEESRSTHIEEIKIEGHDEEYRGESAQYIDSVTKQPLVSSPDDYIEQGGCLYTRDGAQVAYANPRRTPSIMDSIVHSS